jgi:hypothetical protein
MPDDLAVSVVYAPQTGSIFGVWYGCKTGHIDDLRQRVAQAGSTLTHPLLMIGMLIELERQRVVNQADKLMDQFSLRSEVLEGQPWTPDTDIDGFKAQEYLALCLQSQSLVAHIQSFKRQTAGVFVQLDELETLRQSTGPKSEQDKDMFIKTGHRIRSRLDDVMNELDDTVDNCRMMTETLSVTMQTV